MGKLIADAEKEVLVEIVRFTQKHGLGGAEGGWKDFLTQHDKKFGAGLSDPMKRSKDILSAFLKTFSADFQKYFDKMIRRHMDQNAIEQYMKNFPDMVSPEQNLVQLTAENPEFRKNYTFPSYQEGWKVICVGKASKVVKSRAMMLMALDCEMVLCQDGTEAVVRVCVVDQNLEVKLDKLVNPLKAIADYRTHITGVSKKDLEGVTFSLADVQKSLKKILAKGKILVGHSLFYDLNALKFDYARVIDTSCIFKYVDLPAGASASLNGLCKSVLGSSVREEGEPHNCLKDAQAAMNLVLAKLEHGFNDPIIVAASSVPDSDLSKLLVHKIPVDVTCQEVLKIFSGSPSIDDKTDSRVRGGVYSTFVLFNNRDEANKAFKELDGQDKKDSSGRPQKCVFLKQDNGNVASLYVRKMKDDVQCVKSELSKKKRQLTENDGLKQGEDGDTKRQRICKEACGHTDEIERLKDELRQKDDEIMQLQKILSAMSRRQGL